MVYPLSAKTALQPCLLLFNCHGKPSISAIVCDKSKLLKSKQKAPNFWSPAPSNCVSLQKYSVFSTMQGCIVPHKSIKLIWRLNYFYPSSAFCQSGISSDLFCKVNYLNKYGFQPPCPPCHLFNRSTDKRVDFVCTRSNRHTLVPAC